jgi:hypothetical protein
VPGLRPVVLAAAARAGRVVGVRSLRGLVDIHRPGMTAAVATNGAGERRTRRAARGPLRGEPDGHDGARDGGVVVVAASAGERGANRVPVMVQVPEFVFDDGAESPPAVAAPVDADPAAAGVRVGEDVAGEVHPGDGGLAAWREAERGGEEEERECSH